MKTFICLSGDRLTEGSAVVIVRARDEDDARSKVEARGYRAMVPKQFDDFLDATDGILLAVTTSAGSAPAAIRSAAAFNRVSMEGFD